MIPAHVEAEFLALKNSSRVLRQLGSEIKNAALLDLAARLPRFESEILAANAQDVGALPTDVTDAYRDRLTVTSARLEGMIESLRQVAALPDPVGEIVEQKTLANGLRLRRVRAPFGVIFMIFESRPNVILEAFSLAFKTGNAIALRGGKESKQTAFVFYRLMRESLSAHNIDPASFYGMNDYDRSIVESLLKKREWIDVVVPRGGEKLIEFVQQTSLMPIIKNDRGLCHAYVDDEADLDMAIRIVENGKMQRPSVCNSLETVLVHERVAADFLPRLHEACAPRLRWRADAASLAALGGRAGGRVGVEPASARDFDTEHLDHILNSRVVSGLDEAMSHIATHGSQHSETIITQNESRARLFQAEVDAAAVYWNASTRFTDGFEFGLGGELGISTQRLHVRGPVGLRELTTPRWLIDGNGQIRG